MVITWYGNTCIGLSIKARGSEERSALFFPRDRTSRARTLQDRAAIFLEDRELPIKKEEPLSPAPSQFLISYSGEYERAGFVVRGIPVAEGEGARNTLYVVLEEGMRIAHLGFVKKPALSDQELEQVGTVDILLLPVGGGRVLGPKEAAKILEQIEPRIVIPIAFRTDKTKEFGGLEAFLKEIGGRKPEPMPRYTAKPKDLPQEGMQLIVLEAQ